MTATASDKRDLLIWRIRDIQSGVRPEDMTDAELEAALAIFGLAAVRLSPGPKFRVEIDPLSVGSPSISTHRREDKA
jgi:hypothetical protein